MLLVTGCCVLGPLVCGRLFSGMEVVDSASEVESELRVDVLAVDAKLQHV